MWFFMIVFLVPFPCNAKGQVSMSLNGNVNVTVGRQFNLTCNFSCLAAAHRAHLLKNNKLLSEVKLAGDSLESKHTIVLFLHIPEVQHSDSGHYRCQSHPPGFICSVNVNVVDPGERMAKDEHNVTDAVLSESSSGAKSPCSAPLSWNAPLWYLLCKTALFLICSLTVVLKRIC